MHKASKIFMQLLFCEGILYPKISLFAIKIVVYDFFHLRNKKMIYSGKTRTTVSFVLFH